MTRVMAIVGALLCGACASVPMKVGHAYEITWDCPGGPGVCREAVLIAAAGRGWVQDADGYVFRVDRPLWFREIPVGQHPAVPHPSPTIRAEDDTEPRNIMIPFGRQGPQSP